MPNGAQQRAAADRDRTRIVRGSDKSSEPERTRSLPNRDLDLRHENFAVKAPGDFGRIGRFEEQRERLDEVSSRFFNRRTLACDIEVRAQRYKAVILAFDNRG
jgi:hypothetical protein